MAKPTDAELKQALAKAAEMREYGDDPDFLAKSLLSLNYRFNNWQRVISATKLYLHSGHGATEHARLIRALQEAEKADLMPDHDNDFGLE